MPKRILLLILIVGLILPLSRGIPVRAGSTSLENKNNFDVQTSTYDQSLLVGSTTGYVLTAGDFLSVHWKGQNAFGLPPRMYLLSDTQFHGWDYYQKMIIRSPATRGYILRYDSWEMTANYTAAVSGTYYVIIDNTNWAPSILPSSMHIILYEAVQNYPDSYYLSVKTDPTGIVTIPGENWYLRGHNTTLTAPINVTISSVLQYRFDYWDVDGISYGKRINPIIVCVYPNRTATAHYVLYQTLEHMDPFSFTTSTRDTSPRALVGSDTGYSLTAGQTLFVTWSGAPTGMGDTNSMRFYLLNSSQIGGWRWVWHYDYYIIYRGQWEETTGYLMKLDSWSMTASCPINSTGTYYVILVCEGVYNPMDPIIGTPAIYVTSYDAYTLLSNRYYLSVKTDPLGITSIIGEGWYDQGDNPVLTAPMIVTVSPSARYSFDYWDLDGAALDSGTNPITVGMTSNHTATAHYTCQYQVSFTQSGVDSSASGSIVTVNDVPEPYANLPFTFWKNNGSVIVYSYNATVPGSIATKQFVLKSVIGPTSPMTITEAITVTGNYGTQYYLAVKTDPDGIAPISGEGWYDQASSVTLTAPVAQNYTFVYWDVDSVSQGNGTNPITTTMNAPHAATAHYVYVNPLTVHIQPTSATINLGQSVTFTSTVQGGTPPYTYQWYQNGNTVSGAMSNGWTFIPSTAGIHYVYLQATDFNNITAQSETARIVVVTSVPVGGYSVSFDKRTIAKPLILDFALVIGLALFLVAFKRKMTKRRD